jgi:hypothetical protein
MSYSITVRGATAAAALAALAASFDEQVVALQPVHARDRDAALGAAEAMAKQLGTQPEGMEVALSLSGSLGWTGTSEATSEDPHGLRDINVTASNTCASAYYTTPAAQPT